MKYQKETIFRSALQPINIMTR